MGSRFERFTLEARRALIAAQSEAARLGHSHIGPEHLLLAISATRDSTAAALLVALGADLEDIRKSVEASVAQSSQGLPDARGITPDLRHVFENAVEEARALDERRVGLEHLLLGLLQAEDEAGVLHKTKITVEGMRAQVRSLPKRHRNAFSLEDEAEIVAPHPMQRRMWGSLPLKVSPVFVLILLSTIGAGVLIYRGEVNIIVRILLFVVFVAGGWIISLCLHEFSHAAVAFWGGDRGVVEKGYLTLNPLST